MGAAIISLPLAACAGSSPPAESPGADSTEATAEPNADPSALTLANAVATQIASRWNTEKAAAAEEDLTLRVKVDGMSAIVVGNREGAHTLTGSDAVNTEPDVLVEMDKEAANLIAEGRATLHSVHSEDKLTTTNEPGLARFLEYLDE
jgi:hypothetical protein